MPRIGWMKLPLGLLVTLRDFFFFRNSVVGVFRHYF